ncbi:MAG: 30S ribosome-binding factor RbfA [Bacillota bacterium]|jgi:ribosome-binding factor A|nr:30S ribosome-binding factor RbfA [Bacillota bacterium]NLM09111.1 30S ribosome-binding factor RbfA [Clostridiales Family XIII bacterium]
MGKGYRAGRLGEEIRKVVSELLLKEIKDPRLSGIVSISAVEVTADYSYATLYISILDDTNEDGPTDSRKQEVLNAFQSAKGLIRREVARQIKLRSAPDLLFRIDTSMEYGRRITKVLNQLGLGDDRKEEDGEKDKQ